MFPLPGDHLSVAYPLMGQGKLPYLGILLLR